MEKLRQRLSMLPPALFTVITVIAILWLTLFPKPLGDEPPRLFPGADKIVHGLMFGFLTVMMLLDWQRRHRWTKVTWGLATLYATSNSIFGLATECAQSMMGIGREFEWADTLADTVGCFVFAVLWMFTQKNWLRNTP